MEGTVMNQSRSARIVALIELGIFVSVSACVASKDSAELDGSVPLHDVNVQDSAPSLCLQVGTARCAPAGDASVEVWDLADDGDTYFWVNPPEIAWTGQGYGLAWVDGAAFDDGSTHNLVFQLMDDAGVPSGSPVQIGSHGYCSIMDLMWAHDHFLLLYMRTVDTADGPEGYHTVLLDGSGQVMDDLGGHISYLDSIYIESRAKVFSYNNGYLVVGLDCQNIYMTLLDSNGAGVDHLTDPVFPRDDVLCSFAAAWTGSEIGVLYHGQASGNVIFLRIDPQTGLIPPTVHIGTVSDLSFGGKAVAIETLGSSYGLAWFRDKENLGFRTLTTRNGDVEASQEWILPLSVQPDGERLRIFGGHGYWVVSGAMEGGTGLMLATITEPTEGSCEYSSETLSVVDPSNHVNAVDMVVTERFDPVSAYTAVAWRQEDDGFYFLQFSCDFPVVQ